MVYYFNCRIVVFRFKTYYNDTMPIINHYESKGLVKKIAALRSPDEVSINLIQLCLPVYQMLIEVYVIDNGQIFC